MRRVRFAEWILGMFTGRERAASLAGDLVETAAERGVFWFWSSVARTAGALLWSELAGNLFFVAGLGLRGVLVNFGQQILLIFCSLAAARTGLSQLPLCVPVLIMANYVVYFQTGRWMAWRARGR
jgi:hypothetical protein